LERETRWSIHGVCDYRLTAQPSSQGSAIADTEPQSGRPGWGSHARASIGWTLRIASNHVVGSVCSRCRRCFVCRTRDTVYRALFRNSVSWDFDMAPTFVCAGAPFLNNMSVGTPRMPYLAAVPGHSSTSTLTIRRRSANSTATCSRTGAIILQGPHQVAIKSTSTGVDD